MDILQIVENTIKDHLLIKEKDRVLVALSGGSDSVVLLHALCNLRDKYNFSVAAAHINHMLRDTADRDEAFSKDLCKKLEVELFVKKADVKKLSCDAKMGEEQFARDLRYEFFASLGFDKIATAHNRDDVAETLLFNFMRGAGVRGLSGIPYKRDNIIRPLLDVRKSQILEYCKECGYEYVTDETNFAPIYSRNKIRLELIPWIEKEFNPSFTEVVSSNARHLKEDSDFLDSLAKKAYNGEIRHEMQKELEKPVFIRAIALCYKEASGREEPLPRIYLEKIAELVEKNKSGHKIHLPHEMEAEMEFGRLVIRKRKEPEPFEYDIVPNKVLNIPEIGKNIVIREAFDKGDIYLEDTDGLSVRSRKKGDVFFPKGMKGRKKLSDYFTDSKIPVSKRDSIPLLVKDGELVSVIGYRQDRRFTKNGKAYKIEVLEDNNAD